ncbi:MAG: hypothetical protein ACK4Q6_11775 [Tepidimonas ignava]|uniref:Uncharacterized protein n=1 Tax=Tepidimonas ignava TaxID=114249 RepID=A0A4R3LHD5_9BURK|nr:hypothetical protein [Tepidimonas ignava]TCS99482.1 hypothetical protein EDC36_102159 [Tepidimonas ignava]TSE21982.1 hypothetical protein Tigna_01436 [Tepidimonas ignava]
MNVVRWGGAALAAALLVGCAAQPPVPGWRLDLRQAVEQGTLAYLQGHDRVASVHAQRAQQAAAQSAQATALARQALAHCAAQLAALQGQGCAAAAPYLADATAAEQTYAAWLAGWPARPWEGPGRPDAATLPSAARALAQAWPAPPAADLARWLGALDDPLTRLVVGGWLWHAVGLDGAAVAVLVDTASGQGWRRPLAAWLAVQQRLAERAGDTATAALAQRRLDWLLHPAVAPASGPSSAGAAPQPVDSAPR